METRARQALKVIHQFTEDQDSDDKLSNPGPTAELSGVYREDLHVIYSFDD